MNIRQALATLILPVVFICGFMVIKNLDAFKQFVIWEKPVTSEYKLSTWLWEPLSTYNEERIISLLSQAQAERVDRIYLHIGEYIDLFETPDSPERTKRLQAYDLHLENFIMTAKKYEISIEALAGAPNWATDTYKYLPVLVLEQIIRYNQRHPNNQFEGIHFDIEYYNQKEYLQEKKELSTAFLNQTDQLIDLVNKYNSHSEQIMRIGFSFPFWLDERNKTANHTWAGETKPVTYHLIDQLGSTESGYITLMAYRNFAQGADGTIALVRDEMNYITRSGINVTLQVGQETVKNEE